MPISEKDTAKALKLLQTMRDGMEQEHDNYAAAKLNIAIGAILEASEEAEKTAPTEDQLVELGKRAALANDFRTSSQLGNSYIVRKARLDMFGTKRIARPVVRRVK